LGFLSFLKLNWEYVYIHLRSIYWLFWHGKKELVYMLVKQQQKRRQSSSQCGSEIEKSFGIEVRHNFYAIYSPLPQAHANASISRLRLCIRSIKLENYTFPPTMACIAFSDISRKSIYWKLRWKMEKST
jgi:hypothetical protein